MIIDDLILELIELKKVVGGDGKVEVRNKAGDFAEIDFVSCSERVVKLDS